MSTETTTCCVVGGGPAGAMLGLLLARAGIDVVVLEKHADFLRDHPYIAMVPQRDLLDLLTHEASRYPTFRLRMRTESGTPRTRCHPSVAWGPTSPCRTP